MGAENCQGGIVLDQSLWIMNNLDGRQWQLRRFSTGEAIAHRQVVLAIEDFAGKH